MGRDETRRKKERERERERRGKKEGKAGGGEEKGKKGGIETKRGIGVGEGKVRNNQGFGLTKRKKVLRD